MAIDRTLDDRLRRLMLFRVVIVTTLLSIALYLETISETVLWINPVYLMIIVTYISTAIHAALLKIVFDAAPLVYSQVVIDLLVVTELVHVTGNARGGFVILYPIVVLAGSVLIHRKGGLVLAAIAVLMYAGLLFGVRFRMLPGLELAQIRQIPAASIVSAILIVGMACTIVALTGAHFSERLKDTGQRLEDATTQVADLQELNRTIVASIPSGLLMTDSLGKVIFLNDYGATMLGLSQDEAKGRHVRDAVSSAWPWPPLAIAGEDPRQQRLERVEFSHHRDDGETLELEVTGRELESSRTVESGWLFVIQDLTEMKTLERQMRLKRNLAAMGEMAAQLAHEIRNPLGSISGSAQMLSAESGLKAEQQQLLGIIGKESRRLAETLNQFLLQIKHDSEHRTPIDVDAAIHESITLLKGGHEVRPEHVIEYAVDQGPHHSLIDGNQLRQVFWNLARNGLQAMPDGGTLRFELSRHRNILSLIVKDDGAGMIERQEWESFRPFQSSSEMGTGLGLAIVYRIVRENGGDVEIRRRPSQGTEVEVRLPAASD